jgi:hypothetical protein
MYSTSYLKPLLFPLLSGFGLWNWASSVGRRKKHKFALFSFKLCSFAFLVLCFLLAFALFYVQRCKNAQAPPLLSLLVTGLSQISLNWSTQKVMVSLPNVMTITSSRKHIKINTLILLLNVNVSMSVFFKIHVRCLCSMFLFPYLFPITLEGGLVI